LSTYAFNIYNHYYYHRPVLYKIYTSGINIPCIYALSIDTCADKSASNTGKNTQLTNFGTYPNPKTNTEQQLARSASVDHAFPKDVALSLKLIQEKVPNPP